MELIVKQRRTIEARANTPDLPAVMVACDGTSA